FVEHFNISRDVYEDLYYNRGYYYSNLPPPEILYCGNAKTVDDYFRNWEEWEEAYELRYFDREFKTDIKFYLRKSKISVQKKAYDLFAHKTSTSFSIPEIIYAGQLTKDEVTTIYNKLIKREMYSYKCIRKYNFDAIFEKEEYFRNSIESKSPLEVDTMLYLD
ncbi:MAG: hypothetical protein VB118_12530, partial [Oscillospiraceae bacterium]|nr:hypothetical protein [Oscillospiraceae bacterium]